MKLRIPPIEEEQETKFSRIVTQGEGGKEMALYRKEEITHYFTPLSEEGGGTFSRFSFVQ